jgi:hypothetical protein
MSEERIKYLENEFNLYYKYLRDVSSYILEIRNGHIDQINRDDKNFSEYWTRENLLRMYHILCVYFEMLGLNAYLKNFKTTYEPILMDKKKAIEISSELLQYGDTDEDLFLILEWKRLLAPFNFFWDRNKVRENKKVLEFLECTSEILKLTKTNVYKEDDINSIVREVAKFYFNGVTVYSEGYFIHQFSHYRPDIIIKEFGIAIEYKLIRKDNEIGAKIDELLIDAKRYSGNPNNKKCIAVFCLSKNVKKTKKEIKEDWKHMHFPENWELVIISEIIILKKAKI